MANKMITVASFSSDFEAEIAKGKLQSSGIDSFIFKDDWLPLTATLSVKARIR